MIPKNGFCLLLPRESPIGEMAEWSIAAVLKTVDPHRSGGSNPSLSADRLGEGLHQGLQISLQNQIIVVK